MMAVFPEGKPAGTIGGGNVEYEAIQLARELLKTGENALRRFRFVQDDVTSLNMICGGDLTLHFQYLCAAATQTVELFAAMQKVAGQNGSAWLVRRIEGETVVSMEVVERVGVHDEPAFPITILGCKAVWQDGWLATPIAQAGHLYIFGAGHVSQALVPAAAAVGFRPVVYDDRPMFANPALFPQAERVLCGPFEELEQQILVTPDDYVVIMTQGHQADYEVLTRVLRSGAKYIGCIGSKRKLAQCRDQLLQEGFTAEEYAVVHAPIGLAIGAETPAEIAVSVTAELIATRAGVARQR